MKVTFFSARKFKEIDFIKFLSCQDIVSIHCPLADNTKNLITMKHIKKNEKEYNPR